MSEEFNAEVSEDNLSARLSGGAIHVLTDALVSCFKGSGAINHLECNFEDPDDKEQYTLLMQKRSGVTQGEKIDRLKQENADLIAVLSNAISGWDCEEVAHYCGVDADTASRVVELLNKDD